MVAVVAGVVGLIMVTALVRSGSRRLGVPDPIALLLIGAAVSWVPFVPRVHIDPELVLVVVLPLLLYGAAFTASLPAFRHHLRAILLLSIVLTLLSTVAVGVVAAALVPGLALTRRRQATWSESTLTAWAGMRGAVSLAAVLAIPAALPDGRPFPQRDLIVFVTFVVIGATLLVQGTTSSALARRLPGACDELHEDARNEALARREAADAGWACLDDLERDHPGRSEIVDQLRRGVRNRQISADERLDAVDNDPGPREADTQAQLEPIPPGDDGQEEESVRDTYRRYGQAVLSTERARLLALRDSGRLSEASFTRIQRELDLEHAALLVR